MKTKTATHTPTPWTYLPHYGSNVIYKMQKVADGPHYGIGRMLHDKDAAYIVRAVNAYKALMREHRESECYCTQDRHGDCAWCEVEVITKGSAE